MLFNENDCNPQKYTESDYNLALRKKERFMIRNQVLKIADTHLTPNITELYGLDDYKINVVEAHEGGRNLVYFCENEDKGDKIIRIAFLPDRNTEDFLSELEYVRYLYEHGGSVSNVVDSCNGRLLEEIIYKGHSFFVSVFEKAKGEQLAENGYRYREGVPLAEYFYNCGKTLGKLHALSKGYEPVHRRYSFFDKYNAEFINQIIPDSLPLLKEKLLELIRTLEVMDRNSGTFGMVHFDYSDGNYMIDYETGNITVFDFDNACFCWYMYDLANVWEHGVGWVQFEADEEKRQQFMTEYFETVLEGYKSETKIDDKMLKNLQLFINVNIMESIIDAFEVMHNNGEKPECDEQLSYLIKCMEDEIPYEGFFHEIYSCDEPFEYEAREI
jgi:Ser/Thr protein kinase RdoA (MazF antagonist)